MPRKILLTGSTSFLGARFLPSFLMSGDKIMIIILEGAAKLATPSVTKIHIC